MSREPSLCETQALESLLLSFVFFAFVASFSLMDELSDANLTFHMTVQHAVIFIAGFMLGAKLLRISALREKINSSVLVGLALLLITFWHIPLYWDLAYHNVTIHVLEHVSFYACGAFIYAGQSALGDALKWFLLLLYLTVSTIAGVIFLFSKSPIYQSSPLSQHVELGVYMIVTMPLFFVLIVLTPLYVPRLTTFWASRKLSVPTTIVLILMLLLDHVLGFR